MIEALDTAIDNTATFRLSVQQQRLWAVLASGMNGRVWCALRLLGPLHVPTLRQALIDIVKRHEILRTVFRKQAALKIPFQVILDESDVPWDSLDLAGFDEPTAIKALYDSQNVNPSGEQPPVLRAAFGTLTPDRHLLVLSLPTLCSDVQGLENLVAELGLAYAASVSGEPFTDDAMQYADIAEWQSELLQSDESAAGREFWREQARNVDWQAWQSVRLPTQTQNAAAFLPEVVTLSINPASVDGYSASRGGSAANVLFACWQLFLSRVSGRPDNLATFQMGRNHEELRTAFGPLVKDLPIYVAIEAEQGFHQLFTKVEERIALARDWQDCFPASSDPILIFPLSFGYEDYGEGEIYGGVKFTLVEAEGGVEPYTLKLLAKRQAGKLTLEFRYDAAKLTRSTVARWSEQFQTLLTAALEQPDTPVSRLPLLSEQELHRQLVEWNQTAAEYPRERCFHELFEAQAERTPDRAAVCSEGRQLSYRELNEAANQLAHHLRQCGVGPDQRVGLCLERSVDLLVGMLGIVKAGGAYVPLHTEQPAVRWQQQLAGAVALVTEQKLARVMPAFGGAVVCLDGEAGEWRKQPVSNPALQAKPENLIYVIYTSGSTGTPKGVLVRHRNLVNYAWAVIKRLAWDQAAGLQFATVSTLSADLGNTCIFPALLTGGCVHLIKPEMATDPRALGRYFLEQKIDVLKIVPSHLRALLEAGGGREILPRHSLVLGGEMLTAALLERLEALNVGCAVINHYGPTETTVGSLLLPLKEYAGRAAGLRSIPIGRPIANTRIYVLDAYRQPVAVGVEGELYIAGAGVTAGYLEQAEQTAERFVADLFDSGEQMYRTGDRVRYLADGQVEYLGRADEQVKIRGYRVEPGEVEAVLAEHAGVRQAIVIAREQENGEKQLLGYVVMRAQASTTMAGLQRYLQGRLPDYLVPAALLAIGKVPLTANGKLDRNALPSPEEAAAGAETYAPPETELERGLTAIWEQVLRRRHIGRHDNFFHIGGHSLLATQIVSRVRRTLNIELPLRKLFELPTIAEMAEQIEAIACEQTPTAPPIIHVSREQVLPLSYAQQRLWVLDQLEPDNPLYNITRAWQLQGVLDIGALQQSLNEILRRHETQRTTFSILDGQPIQIIAPSLQLPLVQVDLSHAPADERESEARRLAHEFSCHPFDLQTGPLVRASLYQLAFDSHILVLSMHHIVSDAWSAGVFFRELSHLYDAFVRKVPASLPRLEIQYADYAVWQRAWLTGEVLEKQLDYWRRDLAGAPPILKLPADRVRPKAPTFSGAYETIPLPAAIAAAVAKRSHEAGVTPFITLLTAFALLVGRLSSSDQVVLGTDSANRGRTELEHLIGFFINLLPLRIDLDANPTFKELLARVREKALGAYTNEEVPFDKIVEDLRPERSSNHNPIVQVLFVMQNVPRPPRELAGLEVTAFEVPITRSKFDLAVFVTETPAGLLTHWLYSTELFEVESVRRMGRQFEALLSNASEQPDTRISSLALTTRDEQVALAADRKQRKHAQLQKLVAQTVSDQNG